MSVGYPTEMHEMGAKAIVDFFSEIQEIEAVILYGSCARGTATKDSCLDVMVLVSPEVLPSQGERLEQRWRGFHESENIFERLLQVGEYSHIDLNFIDGIFKPQPHNWTGGPDDFELEIGNTLVYSAPLYESSDRLQRIKGEWLPYYDDSLRNERLAEVKKFFLNNLDHVPLFMDRELYFQAFNRFYDAFREFLQALFISRRTYPIAYDKWIREQIEGILGLPELYEQLPSLLEIGHFESQEILERAEHLEHLFEKHVTE